MFVFSVVYVHFAGFGSLRYFVISQMCRWCLMCQTYVIVVLVIVLFRYVYTSKSVWMLMLTLLLFVISAVSSASAPRVFLSAIIIIFDSDRGDICVFIDERFVIDLLGLICVTVWSVSRVCVCVCNELVLTKAKEAKQRVCVCVEQKDTRFTHTHCISQSNMIIPWHSWSTFELLKCNTACVRKLLSVVGQVLWYYHVFGHVQWLCHGIFGSALENRLKYQDTYILVPYKWKNPWWDHNCTMVQPSFCEGRHHIGIIISDWWDI